jgi:hypothetical protein
MALLRDTATSEEIHDIQPQETVIFSIKSSHHYCRTSDERFCENELR